MTPPLYHPNFWAFPLDQITDVGLSYEHFILSFDKAQAQAVKLFLKYSNLCDHGT